MAVGTVCVRLPGIGVPSGSDVVARQLSLAIESRNEPLNELPPDFVMILTTPPAEPAVLGRDAGHRHGGLLDGVLDVQVVRLTADGLVRVHAVDQIPRVVRHRAADREVAVRTRRMSGRRHQQRGRMIAIRRKQLNQLLREVRRDHRRLHQRVDLAPDDVDGFGHRRWTELRVDREHLRRGQRDGLRRPFEAAQLEGEGVDPGRQARHGVVAVVRRNRRPDTLQVRRRRVDRDPRQGEPLLVRHVAG